MTKKTEISIALLIVLVLIAVLLFLFRRQAVPVSHIESTTDVTVAASDSTTDAVPVVVPPQHATPMTVGRIFVERFGSYSTDVDYANVDDVMPLATAHLRTQLQDIAEESRKAVSSSYYGVSTNVIKLTTDKQTDTTMTMTVKTQREESFDSPANTSVRYQDIRVEFVKVGDDWFVDSFTWL